MNANLELLTLDQLEELKINEQVEISGGSALSYLAGRILGGYVTFVAAAFASASLTISAYAQDTPTPGWS